MWLAKSRQRETTQPGALVGETTLAGSPAGVYLEGERRGVPVFGPGGYCWRPTGGQRVLVLKSGVAGEQPCVAAVECGETVDLAPGEVLIKADSGGATIRLRNDGTVELEGLVRINGKTVEEIAAAAVKPK